MMELAVTAEDCTNGKQENSFYNPIALALQRALRDPHIVVTARQIHTVSCSPSVVQTTTDVEQWLMHWNNDRVSAGPRSFYLPLSYTGGK